MKPVKKPDLAALQARAKSLLEQKLGKTNIHLLEKGAEVDAGVFHFKAAAEKGPNSPSASVFLSAAGEPVSLKKAAAARALVDSAKLKLALADAASISINPAFNDLTLNEGDRFDELITVTVPANLVTPKADVYLLADTTGSMTEEIAAVVAGINSIVSSVSGLGLDVAFGVGFYRDFPGTNPCFSHLLSPTSVVGDINTAVGSLFADGGDDGSEGQFFALDQLAKNPGNLIGWRNNSKKIIVMFGDAPGHDPVCNSVSGIGYDITEASVTADLQAQNITLIAVSVTGGEGLDGNPSASTGDYGSCTEAGVPGQGSRLAAATGGAFVNDVDATQIVNTIIDLLQATVSSINEIKLVPTGSTAPFVNSISPGSYGPLATDVEHTLDFKVSFTGIQKCEPKEQEYFGTIDVVVDGVVVTAKRVRIVVPPCEEKKQYTYVVRFIYGRQDLHGFSERTSYRPGFYRTEIAIHNDSGQVASFQRLLTTLVHAGANSGLNQVTTIAQMEPMFFLQPDFSVFTDPVGIERAIWKGLPPQEPVVTSGFLKIRSDRELHVSAIYTISDLNGNNSSMNVEVYEPKVTVLP